MEHLRIPLLSLLVFLLNLSSLHFLSLADDYFINCGSHDNVSLTAGQNFSGESKPAGYSFSKSKAVKDINQLPDISPLYKTARSFNKPFYYQFSITEDGTYLVRLHFSAFSSSPFSNNLSTAVFGVLDSKNFTLLNNFTAKNTTYSPVIKEFFLRIDITDSFRLYFTPQPSSFAFVNGIELFLAPVDFIPENYTSNLPLHTIYRLNVGGSPLNDTIGRKWETDDSHISDQNSAKKATPQSTLNLYRYGKIDGLVVSNESVAPSLVYQTAREMTHVTSNITWFFSVSSKARHIVRAHFCDIVGQTPGNIIFNLYANGNFRKEIGNISQSSIFQYSAVPFYYDFVVNYSESELFNISIRPNNGASEQNAFLNGLEILEIVEGLAPIPNVKESKKNVVAPVVGSVLGGLSLICVLIVGFVFGFRHRKAEKHVETSVWSPMPANGGGSSHSSALNLDYLGLKISFNEIQSATNNFDTKLVIGKGGFGNVYRGTLLNGTKVAVKRAYKRDEHGSGSGQGLLEFQTEIIVLSKIRHRHLVSLIGYCNERSEMILVYEFMEKGTLRDHLYDSDVPRLSWNQRLEICTGAARGLHYLHTSAARGIIHRDVKSTNILLDENHVAKVADFGLSRSGALDETHVSTNVKGTFGYLDPEYMMSEQLTEKSDVYSFGVVLLEVLCGRPAIDPTLPREQMNLAEWGMLCKKKGLLEQIVDSSLKNQIDPSSLRTFGETAEKCLQDDASDRPTMANVLWDLEYALQLQKTTKLKEAHEDSTTIDASSAAFSLPIVQRFPSLGSTTNGDDMRDSDLDTTENKIFSQLKIGDAR